MELGVWSFARGESRLEISRHEHDDGIVLAIAGDGEPRSYFFREIERLETFQKDMETLLLKTGWVFVTFTPERREGRDRRSWPRRANDRRRWWTDGARDRKPTAQSDAKNSAARGHDHPRTSEK